MNNNLLTNGYPFSQGFVYQISYFFEGRLVSDTVGEASIQNKEIILAISRHNDEYLICTYSRGVTWGKPMIAYAKDIEAVMALKVTDYLPEINNSQERTV